VRLLWVALVVGGCGRYGFSFDRDASVAIDAPIDAAATYRELVLGDGPSGYWRLGDSGGVAVDELGANNGTYSGACGFGGGGAIAADANTAVAFDGASCRVTLPNALGFPGNQPFSVEAWVTGALDGTFRFVFSNETRTAGNPIDGYGLLMQPNGLEIERVVNMANSVSPPGPIGATYSHVVGVYDGGSEILYVNGQLVGGKPDIRIANVVGAPAIIGSSSAGNFFLGSIDEVAVYPFALSAAQVAAHYAKGTAP
jgi:hypothetical protein